MTKMSDNATARETNFEEIYRNTIAIAYNAADIETNKESISKNTIQMNGNKYAGISTAEMISIVKEQPNYDSEWVNE